MSTLDTSELFEVFDAHNAGPVGLASRSLVHQTGLIHRGVHVFLFRNRGGSDDSRDESADGDGDGDGKIGNDVSSDKKEVLLQRRVEGKDVCPGRWDLSCAEHLTPGESYAEAARRGLEEELGLAIPAHEIRPLQDARLFTRAYDRAGNAVPLLEQQQQGVGHTESNGDSEVQGNGALFLQQPRVRVRHGGEPASPGTEEGEGQKIVVLDREFDALFAVDDFSEERLGAVQIDGVEVAEVAWVGVADLQQRVRESPSSYTPWLVAEMRACGLLADEDEGKESSPPSMPAAAVVVDTVASDAVAQVPDSSATSSSSPPPPPSDRPAAAVRARASDGPDGDERRGGQPVAALHRQVRASEIVHAHLSGYAQSRMVLAAVELGVFSALGDDALTGRDLAAATGLFQGPGSRARWDFLDGLVSVGLLDREGPSGDEGLYSNAEAAALLLDRRKPELFLGSLAETTAQHSYPQFAQLAEALRTGQRQPGRPSAGSTGAGSAFGSLLEDDGALRVYLQGMGASNAVNFALLASRWPGWSQYQSLCDIGGAAADLCLAVARRHEHIRCKSMDLPPVLTIAQDAIASSDVADAKARIDAVEGDFFAFDPFPTGDVVTMSNILHDWSLEHKKRLVAKAYDAVNPGGAFICMDMLIDSDRRTNTSGMMMGLKMLLEFGDGNAFDYTSREFESWCREAGFVRFDFLKLLGPTVAAIAYKAA